MRHAGRKLQVQGKEDSRADGRLAHRFSCSQELISLSSIPQAARDTNTQLEVAEGCVRDSFGSFEHEGHNQRDFTSATSPPAAAANIT